MEQSTAAELEAFRRQWQDEVRNSNRAQHHAQSHTQPQPQQRADASPSSTSFLPRRRLPSFVSTPPSKLPGAPNEIREDHNDSLQSHPSIRAPIATEDEAPKTALEHYETATQKESEGNLGESLRLYRKAFRMDSRVETKYREKHSQKAAVAGPSSTSQPPTSAVPATSKKNPDPQAPPTTVNTAHHSLTSPSNVSDLVASFAGLCIQAIPPPTLGGGPKPLAAQGQAQDSLPEISHQEEQQGHSCLAALPSELLLHILHFVAQDDMATFSRLALVCKHLAFITTTEGAIWRSICKKSFDAMVWDWKCDYLGKELDPYNIFEYDLVPDAETFPPPPSNSPPPCEQLVSKYRMSYRNMMMDRPRIRYNGVYISTCNYLRQGASSPTMISWNTPVHIVTYYRYLRFYPDGTVLSLLSTHEPAKVVRSFNKAFESSGGLNPWGKYVMRGRWKMDGDGNVDLETEGAGGRQYIYKMALTIKSAGRSQRQNKLVWRGFWSWNRLTDDTAEFSLRNDKAFFFSRVGTYERDWGTRCRREETL